MLNVQDRNVDETFEHAPVCRLRDIRIGFLGIQDNCPTAEARSADRFFRQPYMVQDPKAICSNDYDLQLQVTREIAIVVVRPDRDGNASCAFDEHMCMALRKMGKSLPQRVEIDLAFFDERGCVWCDRSTVPDRVDHELRLATVTRFEKLLYIQVVAGADRFHADRVNSPGSGKPNQAAGHERLSSAGVGACDKIIHLCAGTWITARRSYPARPEDSSSFFLTRYQTAVATMSDINFARQFSRKSRFSISRRCTRFWQSTVCVIIRVIAVAH